VTHRSQGTDVSKDSATT